MIENDIFADAILTAETADAQPFVPFAEYNPDGDCIEFYLSSGSYYGNRLDGLMTIFKSNENDAIVGGMIKGISALLKKSPGIRFITDQNRIQVQFLLVAKLLTVVGPSVTEVLDNRATEKSYKELLDLTSESKVECDLTEVDCAS